MQTALEQDLPRDSRAFFASALARVRAEGARAIPELLPSLPRRIGASPLGGGIREIDLAEGDVARIDQDAWRRCDAAGAMIIAAGRPSDDMLIDLYLHGDLDERIIVIRALSTLSVTAATVRVLEEVQRTNMEPHFRAAASGTNLPARAARHAAFGRDGFNRMILKAAFIDVPVSTLFDAETAANPDLSRMLQDLATEREAAGRRVWPGTCLLAAHAPTAGSLARIIGGLEHGDDEQRFSAARALLVLNRPDLAPFAKERLPREPRPEIRAVLEQAIGP